MNFPSKISLLQNLYSNPSGRNFDQQKKKNKIYKMKNEINIIAKSLLTLNI